MGIRPRRARGRTADRSTLLAYHAPQTRTGETGMGARRRGGVPSDTPGSNRDEARRSVDGSAVEDLYLLLQDLLVDLIALLVDLVLDLLTLLVDLVGLVVAAGDDRQ